MSTFTPLVIIWSAIVAILVLSPSAFWMSYSTPAALNASSRNGRSAVSQRTDDFVSGRITPTFAAFAPPAPVVAAPPPPVVAAPPPAVVAELLPLSSPHAAANRESPTATATIAKRDLRM